MRIGQYDSWNERDNIDAVIIGHEKAVNLAHTSSIPNEPSDCWRFAKDALTEFGCDAAQAAQLMSNTKDFDQFYNCDNLKRDVHVLRAFLGRCAYRARLHLNPPTYTRIAEECIRTGITVIGPDELGLSDDQRIALKRELSTDYGAPIKNTSNMIAWVPHRFQTSNLLLSMIAPVLSQITGYKLQTITEELARTAFSQRIVNVPEDNDARAVMRQDTWHDAWRLWYFPDDVRAGEAPFRFARNSHGLSAARLRLTRDFAMPGRTLKPTDFGMMGCESEDIICSAGTLVIANVFGFHAWGEVTKISERNALHASIHLNPWAV